MTVIPPTPIHLPILSSNLVLILVDITLGLVPIAYFSLDILQFKYFYSDVFRNFKDSIKQLIVNEIKIVKKNEIDEENSMQKFFSRLSGLYLFYNALSYDFRKKIILVGLLILFLLILGFILLGYPYGGSETLQSPQGIFSDQAGSYLVFFIGVITLWLAFMMLLGWLQLIRKMFKVRELVDIYIKTKDTSHIIEHYKDG